MKISTRLGGVSLLLLAYSSFADIDGSTAAVKLSPIVVTASRTIQSVDEVLASVTVISREQLEQRQTSSVVEALNGLAGIQFTNSGGAGKATSLFMRGTNSDHVLVLIDGVKVGSATLGTAAFQHISVDQIDHIEVVRGPRSSLYGSEAIGGVIQIFTRNGKHGSHKSAHRSVGAHDYHGGGVSVSERFEGTWISFSGDVQRTDGINAKAGATETDRDGYRRKSASFRIGHQLTNNLELEFHTLHAEGENEFDGSFQDQTDFLQQVTGGIVRWDVNDAWQLTGRVGISKDETENGKSGVFASLFDTQRISRSLQSDYQLTDDQLVTLGYDFQDDQITSDGVFTETSRRNEGLFAQYLLEMGSWSLQASGRHDSNEQFGGYETGSVAVGYLANNGVMVSLSHGTAYKAPTFNELFFPGFGNPDLDPEESKTTELGFSGTLQQVNWSANFYRTSVDELIAFVFTPPSTFAPVNVAEATLSGIELQASTRVSGWDINSQVTFLDAKNEDDGANHGNQLNRRARRSLRMDADRQIGKWQVGGSLFARGKAYNDVENNDRIGGFVTLDLRAAYRLTPELKLQGKLNNAFDKKYRTVSTFNQDGANLMFTLRWQQR